MTSIAELLKKEAVSLPPQKPSRTITGACQQGVSHFLTSKNYKAKLSVQFVIDETRGQYGYEIFEDFFTRK